MVGSLGGLGALAGLAAREEADDLGVVLGGVDVVRATRRRDHVEQLGMPLEDLPSARVALESEELSPQLACQDDRRSPFAVSLGDGDRGPRTLTTPGAHQRRDCAGTNERLVAQ